jgi:hypothetical protein
MSDREQYDAWIDANFDRNRLPRSAVEFGFEAWAASRQELIAASGAPVAIHVIPEAE